MEVRLSTMPSSIAAIRVPGRLPIPPSTQIAKIRPIYSRPTDADDPAQFKRERVAGIGLAPGKSL